MFGCGREKTLINNDVSKGWGIETVEAREKGGGCCVFMYV